MELLFILLSGVVGLVIGILVMFGISKAGLNKDQQKAAQILEQADIQADAKVKQAILDGRTQVHELKIEAEKEIKERRQEITEMENKLLRREDNLNFRDETLAARKNRLTGKVHSCLKNWLLWMKRRKSCKPRSMYRSPNWNALRQ